MQKYYALVLRLARIKIEAQERRYKEDLLEQERRKAERIRQQEEHDRTIREQRLEQLKRNGTKVKSKALLSFDIAIHLHTNANVAIT